MIAISLTAWQATGAPPVTQDSLVASLATGVAVNENGHQQTPQSHLEACQRISRGTPWRPCGDRQLHRT
jgi:hypothetical protein